MRSVTRIAAAALIALAGAALAQERGAKLRELLKDAEPAGDWIYDDLGAALERASTEGKPVLAVLRCVP